MIKRALISVWDKAGLEPFAGKLASSGVTIISSGGTAKFLSQAGIPVVSVEEITGFPEILDGRVKTLHPHIHGALLARRSNKEDMETLGRLGIEPLDLVVVNLYPFTMMKAQGLSDKELVEFIDIGGPTLLRAAAKNFEHVLVVSDPGDYPTVADLVERGAEASLSLRRKLAAKVFEATSVYDQAVRQWMGQGY
jgi:phosphoribosylaminoimidazolecarboxamide formyltransferase / IMP cyclohydrolase